MIEPNDIWHFSFPVMLNARKAKPTTSLHSTQKSQDHGEFVTRVAFAQQMTTTVSSVAPFYQFAAFTSEATAADTSSPLPVAAVAAIQGASA